MTLTILETRQIQDRSALPALSTGAGASLDTILNSINNEIQSPFLISVDSVNTKRFDIAAAKIQNPTSTGHYRLPQPISKVLSTFTAGTITLPSSGTGSIAVSPGSSLTLSMIASQYCAIGIAVNFMTGNIVLLQGAAAATLSTAISYTNLPSLQSPSCYDVGFIIVRTDGTNTVQNVAASDIYQYSSSGSGSGLAVTSLTSAQAVALGTLSTGVHYVIDTTDASGDITVTLPAGASGENLKICNASRSALFNRYNIIVTASGSDTIYQGTGASTYSLSPDKTIELVWNINQNSTPAWVIEQSSLTIQAFNATTGTNLNAGVHYVIDMSAASGNLSIAAPAGLNGRTFKVSTVGNTGNNGLGYTVTITATGTDKFYYNGLATNASYIITGDTWAEFSWDNSTLGVWQVDVPGGMQIRTVTGANLNTTTLINNVHYIADLSAGSSISVTAPAGKKGSTFRIFSTGNLSNGNTITINPNGSDNIYQNGTAANTAYTIYSLESYVEFIWDDKTLNAWVIEVPGAGSGSGGGSPLDPDPESTFIYNTRSDFGIEKKTYFGSTSGTDNVLGLGKIVMASGATFTSLDVRGHIFISDNPLVNSFKVKLLYNSSKVDRGAKIEVSNDNGSTWVTPIAYKYAFKVSGVNTTVGAVYTNNGQTFTVVNAIASGTDKVLVCYGTGAPTAGSGSLIKSSGTGTDPISYTDTYGAGEASGNMVIADFVLSTAAVSTGVIVRVTASGTITLWNSSAYVNSLGSCELVGFSVDMVQDSTGAYAGDATKEIRVITAGEASSGMISLVSVKFTPGAGQIHCNYKGHDFIEPDFIALGGGVVQFPINFFASGDTAKFYVGYGLVNLSNAPVTIQNIVLTYSAITSAATLSTQTYASCSGATTYAVTLPTAVGVQGLVYTVKSNMNAGVILTVNTTSSQTIDGSTSITLSRYSSLMVISNGSNWEII